MNFVILAEESAKIRAIDEVIKWTLMAAPFVILLAFVMLLYEFYSKSIRETDPNATKRKKLRKLEKYPTGLQYYVDRHGEVKKESPDNQVIRLKTLDNHAISVARTLGYSNPRDIINEFKYTFKKPEKKNKKAVKVVVTQQKEVEKVKLATKYKQELREKENNKKLVLTKKEYNELLKKYDIKK